MAHIDYAAQWHQINNYFRVEIDGLQFSVAEVTGLEREVEVIEYRAGDDDIARGGWKHVRSGLAKRTGELTLKKAVYEGDDHISTWFNEFEDSRAYGSHEDGRLEILVTLLDEEENEIMNWNFYMCWPSKIKAPSLKADDSSYAAEEISFVYEYMRQEIL